MRKEQINFTQNGCFNIDYYIKKVINEAAKDCKRRKRKADSARAESRQAASATKKHHTMKDATLVDGRFPLRPTARWHHIQELLKHSLVNYLRDWNTNSIPR